MIKRRETRRVSLGQVQLGETSPILIQSMTNTDTRDRAATLAQIEKLTRAGAEVIRLAVPDQEAATHLKSYVTAAQVPLVADIHFDYRLALQAIDAGIHKLRINPGNIGPVNRVRELARRAQARQIPIRIGVNAGSLEKDLLQKYQGPTPEALVASALRHVQLLEAANFSDIVISIKSSRVPDTVAAYRLLSQQVDYPLHIGITEAGTWFKGSIRSAVGLGILLGEGIGDTLRVSLTGDPLREIEVGREILQALGIRSFGPTVIACPTCGRCRINLEDLALAVEKMVSQIEQPLKIAVMGCGVNGPGEAREADLGVAGGQGEGLIFRKGEIIRKVPEKELLTALQEELNNYHPTNLLN